VSPPPEPFANAVLGDGAAKIIVNASSAKIAGWVFIFSVHPNYCFVSTTDYEKVSVQISKREFAISTIVERAARDPFEGRILSS
jgi:hypothetical protein